MKNIPLLTLAALLFTTINIAAQSRTFTSTDGRTLDAEIVSATPDMVTLKLLDGTTPVVPLARLSAADQAHIGAWRKANPADVRYNFNIDYAKSRTSGPRERPRGNSPAVVVSKEKWVCTFKVQNRSGQALENVEVKYQVHYLDDDGKNPEVKQKYGTKKIPLIKTNEILSVDTDPLELKVTQLSAGWVWKDGRKRAEDDGVKGAAVTLMHNGKIVHEFTTRGVTKAEKSQANNTANN